MSPKSRRSRLVLLAALPFLGSACADDAPQDIFKPDGQVAESINELQIPVFIAAGVVGVLVAVGLAFVVWTGYRNSKRDDVEPRQLHGNYLAEITWTAVPFLILVGVAVPTVATILDITEEPDEQIDVAITVYGQQWWWSYEYDIGRDGTIDIVTANELVIPVGETIQLDVTSRDVIHSFWIPALAGTKDAVPGRVHTLKLHADEPGRWLGQCKEYCGLSHANMRASAVALAADDWDRWLRENSADAPTPAPGSLAAAGLEIFTAKCASCHQVDGLPELENVPLVAGAAPNLTHLMNRTIFASGEYDLWVAGPDGRLVFNRSELEAWLRDPEALLPMAPDEGRGMPNLGLDQDEIDLLIEYLLTLGPYPDGAVPPESAPAVGEG